MSVCPSLVLMKRAAKSLVVVDNFDSQCLYVDGVKCDWFGDDYCYVSELGVALGAGRPQTEPIQKSDVGTFQWWDLDMTDKQRESWVWPERLEEIESLVRDEGALF